MIRDIFFNKWILAIIGLLAVVAAACVCYYYYATLPLSIEAAKASELTFHIETILTLVLLPRMEKVEVTSTIRTVMALV